MNTVQIRELALGEQKVLALIYGQSFDEPYPEPVSTSLLLTAGAWCDIARVGTDEEPAGFVIGRIIFDEAEILSIGTIPAMRRRGVARQLLEAAFARARKARARVMHLEVGEDNSGAMALYDSLGFRRVGRRPDYYRRADRSRVAAVLMTVELDCGQ